jgi:hypothetical protein
LPFSSPYRFPFNHKHIIAYFLVVCKQYASSEADAVSLSSKFHLLFHAVTSAYKKTGLLIDAPSTSSSSISIQARACKKALPAPYMLAARFILLELPFVRIQLQKRLYIYSNVEPLHRILLFRSNWFSGCV